MTDRQPVAVAGLSARGICRPLVMLFALSLVNACASVHIYSKQVTDNTFHISAEGSPHVDRKQVELQAIYKAAQLTVETGKDEFKIVSAESIPQTKYDGFGDVVRKWFLEIRIETATSDELAPDAEGYIDAHDLVANVGPVVETLEKEFAEESKARLKEMTKPHPLESDAGKGLD